MDISNSSFGSTALFLLKKKVPQSKHIRLEFIFSRFQMPSGGQKGI